MALNFNEGAYGQAYQQGQQNRQDDRDRLLQLIQSVGPAIGEIGKGYQQNKEDNMTLDQLLSSSRLSSPVSPIERIDSMKPNQMMDFSQLPNNPMGMAPQSEVPQVRPGNHVEGFQNFLKGQTQPLPQAQPQPMQQPSPFGQYGGMTVGQLRRLPEQVQKSMFQPQKQEVENFSFIGTNDQGQPVFADKSGTMKIGLLPTGGKLQPKPTATATVAGIKPPSGYRFTTEGNLEMIPGGPADTKSQMEKQKQDQALASLNQDAQMTIAKIDSTLGKINGMTAGGMGQATSGIPFIGQLTGATDLTADLDSIASSLGLNKLMEMKNNSKAGASGMGQLSDREMTLLTSAIASIKQSQNPEQLKRKLLEIKNHYQNIIQMSQGINPYQNGQNQTNSFQSKPKTVIQNGHTYTLNEATGQYE